MSKAAEFRARAVECEKKASEAKDAEAKRLLIEAAQQWHSMAALAERELDIADRNFPTKYVAWTDQIRFEMDGLLALTKQTISESRTLMAEIDLMLARR